MRFNWREWTRTVERRRPPLLYSVNLRSPTLPACLTGCFIESNCDEETQKWLEDYRHPSAVKLVLSSALQYVFSRTATNGILNRGGMHVLSPAQASALLTPSLPTCDDRQLLDIGAGDGGVTANIAPLFSSVFATEASAPMRYRLRQRGYDSSDMPPLDKKFDCVALMNILDRCDEPRSLLKDVRTKYLKPGGVVLLAIVLPWCPFVENGTRKDPPKEQMSMSGACCLDKPTFETAAGIFAERALVECGFQVERWTRVPYLCEGNTNTHEYFKLDNAVFVLKVNESWDESQNPPMIPANTCFK